MIIFVVIILIVLCTSITDREEGADILDRNTSRAVEGIFILFVFLSHSCQYLSLEEKTINWMYILFRNYHGQLVVAPFLFFSGYGVMEQIKSKGAEYITSFPKKRIVKTLINFDCAVLIYIFVALILGSEKLTVKNVLLAFTGWTSVGNSNWYIFCILIMYLISYVSYKICWNMDLYVLLILICSCGYMLAMRVGGQPLWFYNTCICYVFGCFFSFYKTFCIDMINRYSLESLISAVVLFVITYFFCGNAVVMNVHACLFVICMVLFLKKHRIMNGCFEWFGTHLFGIFILQRLPMIVFQSLGFEWYIFVPLCFGSTLVLVLLFEQMMKLVNLKIF